MLSYLAFNHELKQWWLRFDICYLKSLKIAYQISVMFNLDTAKAIRENYHFGKLSFDISGPKLAN